MSSSIDRSREREDKKSRLVLFLLFDPSSVLHVSLISGKGAPVLGCHLLSAHVDGKDGIFKLDFI